MGTRPSRDGFEPVALFALGRLRAEVDVHGAISVLLDPLV